MSVSEHKLRTLQALRDGPLEHSELVVRLERAPYFVRQDLDDLRRDRLVRKTYTRRAITWELTELGVSELNQLGQMQLGEAGR